MYLGGRLTLSLTLYSILALSKFSFTAQKVNEPSEFVYDAGFDHVISCEARCNLDALGLPVQAMSFKVCALARRRRAAIHTTTVLDYGLPSLNAIHTLDAFIMRRCQSAKPCSQRIII